MSFSLALVIFALNTIILLLVEVGYTYSHFGTQFGWSSNRPTDAKRDALGVRIRRAFQNHIEAAAYAVPVLGVAAITGHQHGGAEIAALLFVVGRAAFGPLYYTGVPFIRLPAWGMGWISIAYIAITLLTSGNL
ncbi:MAG: MAPEG family protein [Myxococcales bacterium]|nr:MAPEG family protein [Myxococcales bacterium]